MRTATRHEGRLVRGAAEIRSLRWGIASLILLFNGLLVAWVLLKPGSDAVVAIVVNVAEFVGPLLVLPLCFGGLRRLWRRGTSRTDNGKVHVQRGWEYLRKAGMSPQVPRPSDAKGADASEREAFKKASR